MTSADPSELRVVLDGDAIPLERRIRRIAVNALPVVQQSVEVAATFEARGTGLPDQEVPFDSTDLLNAHSLEIHVGDEVWEERSSLDGAGPEDRVYVRRPRELVFGNGVNGRVPAKDASIQRGPITRTRGDRAHVRAGLAWDVPALGPDGSAFATTISPIGGGTAATDPADLMVAARQSAVNREALLTDDELRAAARRLPGFAVARAEVLDGFHPDVPDQRIDGTRTLVVIPHRRGEDPAVPPRPAYLAAVQRLLAGGRVLGERLVIAGHAIVAVTLEVTIVARAGVDPEGVRAQVARRLRCRFTDVAWSDDIAPWPLGRTVTCVEVTSLTALCDGVLAVKSCAIGRVGEPRGEASIDLDRDEVAVAGELDVRVEVAPT